MWQASRRMASGNRGVRAESSRFAAPPTPRTNEVSSWAARDSNRAPSPQFREVTGEVEECERSTAGFVDDGTTSSSDFDRRRRREGTVRVLSAPTTSNAKPNSLTYSRFRTWKTRRLEERHQPDSPTAAQPRPPEPLRRRGWRRAPGSACAPSPTSAWPRGRSGGPAAGRPWARRSSGSGLRASRAPRPTGGVRAWRIRPSSCSEGPTRRNHNPQAAGASADGARLRMAPPR